jgi:hypothetical protein
MSKAMVATLTSIMLQKPHFLLVKRKKGGNEQKTPKNRNITKSTTDVASDMGASKNFPIPTGEPFAAKAILPTNLRT